MKKFCLGIDTSNYTTSLALVDMDRRVVADKRKILDVPMGKCGLSQSEAFFQHNRNFPSLFECLQSVVIGGKIIAVAASTAPRPVSGSYMPVFLLGANYGKAISSINNIPFVEVTHQEGHLMAGIWSAKMRMDSAKILAVHLSGGTTEIMKVELKDNTVERRFRVQIVGGSEDLQIGQFIDRVGVALGLKFPAGKELEQMMQQCPKTELRLPISVKDNTVSFSGPESAAQRAISSGHYSKEEIALAVHNCISESITKLVGNCLYTHGLKKVLFVGGVASNQYLRAYLTNGLRKSNEKTEVFFAEKYYSSDNAVGAALLGLERVKGKQGLEIK